MSQKIFVNIVTKDLPKAKAFYEAIGWKINPQFTDDTAAAVNVSDEINFMVLTEEKMKTFTDKKLVDSTTSLESIFGITVDSKEAVDAFMQKVLAAGGKEPRDPQVFEGFMYNRSFEDLDGHAWEIFWMNETAAA